ncbi:non-ribosomal peptide synthetase [Azospirillum soli]|uniref:non-ribosomal peptide synthetase n=1 Tax=Azospirillum soli TaxID=1304799 RepID=UPI001AE45ABA|nr:non-ribosomal peptide synthetase [Azospirillum soli]MBP2314308.1 amino acid adenylation domain-containing protein [Azospirillum soli]
MATIAMDQNPSFPNAHPSAESHMTATGPMLTLLADIWREVLDLNRPIEPAESFFEIGGHSLSATLVLFEVAVRTGKEIPVGVFFKNPRLGDFAVAVESYRPDAPDTALGTNAEAAPGRLSFQQRQLWLIDRLEGSSAQYNVLLAYQLRGPLDVARLTDAFGHLTAHHPILNTVYRLAGDEPEQVVLAPRPVRLPVENLGALPSSAREEAWRTAAREMAGIVFDLEQAPPVAARLLRLAEGDHVLLVTVHHIAFDGWSADVFLKELIARYEEQDEAGSPPFSYTTYAERQAAEMVGPRRRILLDFWRAELAGLAERADLIPDYPARLGRRGACGMVRRRLDGAAFEALKTLAARVDTTLFVVLFGLYALLVARHTRSRDVVIGTPMANRGRLELTRAIGFFANSLVLRRPVDANQPLADFLRETAAQVQRAFEHQDIPFELLVEALSPPRSNGRNPLFDIVFVLQHRPKRGIAMGGAAVEILPVDNTRAKFDLILNVLIDEDGLTLEFEFDAALFDAGRIAAMADQYRHLAETASAALGCPIGELDAHPASERALLAAVNDTDRLLPFASVAEAFAAVVARWPVQTAMIEGDTRLDYQTLDRMTDHMAAALRRVGVVPGHRVGLALPRGADGVAAMLAILKCGAAYVPLDLAYPQERLSYMVEDASIAHVIARSDAVAHWDQDGGFAGRARILDIDALRIAPEEGAGPSVSAGPADPAYVMYTSGSTGRPKGVAVPQEGILRLVLDPGYVTVGPESRVLHASSVSFDASTFEVWAPLLSGGTLVIHPGGPFDLAALLATVENCRVDTTWLTAGALDGLVALGPVLPNALRQLLTGGDVVSAAAVRKLYDHNPALTIINGYGPTENTTFTCCHVIPRDHDPAAPLPVGRPIRGTAVEILDDTGRPAGIGVPGELVAIGRGVGLGYLNQPDQTAERFSFDCPYGLSRSYRTGDLARWRPDGRIDFLGRMDGQVKIRGFRIELGEVEKALAGAPGVAEAAVTVHGAEAGSKFLVGWVAAASGGTVSLDAVDRWMARALPQHLRPARVLVVDSIPMTINGKVDRKALATRYGTLTLAGGGTAACTATEARLAGLWQDLLSLAGPPGRDDGFFSLGGHSLLAVRLVAGINDAWGLDFPIRIVFDHPTVRAMGKAVDEALAQREEGTPATAGPNAGRLTPITDGMPPTWIAIPGIGATGAAFLSIGRALAARRDGGPVTAIEPRGLFDDAVPCRSMAEIVADTLDLIRRCAPAGLIRLMGHSFGGRVAFEAAAALEAEGRAVDLVLLDALPGNTLVDVRDPGFTPDDDAIAAWLLRAVGLGDMATGRSAVAALGEAGLVAERRVGALLAVARAQFEANGVYDAAGRRYGGHALLLYAEDSLIGRRDPPAIRADLALHCPGASIAVVSGDHFSMLRLGDHLAAAITAFSPASSRPSPSSLHPAPPQLPNEAR